MNDWIDRATEEHNEEIRAVELRRQLIGISNYWLKLRQQIDKDVAKLNNDSPWSGMLKAIPLKIIDHDGGCYEIEKGSLDAVSVSVRNSGEEIVIGVKVVGFGFKQISDTSERWRVDADEIRAFLTRGDQSLTVPEQVSEYILKPIIKVLDTQR